MSFSLGQTIILRTSSTLIRYSVLKVFQPFTRSAVLLVQEQQPNSTPQILKIFDPRYLNERISFRPAEMPHRPWSLDLEQEAARRRDTLAREGLENTYDYDELWDDEPPEHEQAARRQRAVLWEEHFHCSMKKSYEAEILAYKRLREFQGGFLPRLIHCGTIAGEEGRSFEPSAIIIEYIHGHSLENVPLNLIVPSLYEPLLHFTDRLQDYGIAHSDLRAGNILFTPADKPTRAVIIDFGNSRHRRKEYSDEYWKRVVRDNGDFLQIRIMLERRGVVLYSDPSKRPYITL